MSLTDDIAEIVDRWIPESKMFNLRMKLAKDIVSRLEIDSGEMSVILNRHVDSEFMVDEAMPEIIKQNPIRIRRDE